MWLENKLEMEEEPFFGMLISVRITFNALFSTPVGNFGMKKSLVSYMGVGRKRGGVAMLN